MYIYIYIYIVYTSPRYSSILGRADAKNAFQLLQRL